MCASETSSCRLLRDGAAKKERRKTRATEENMVGNEGSGVVIKARALFVGGFTIQSMWYAFYFWTRLLLCAPQHGFCPSATNHPCKLNIVIVRKRAVYLPLRE